MNLLWIAGLTILILVEKIVPTGRLIPRISGALIAAAGVWLLIRALLISVGSAPAPARPANRPNRRFATGATGLIMPECAASPSCSTGCPDARAQRQAAPGDRLLRASTPDPDRGWALAAMTGDLQLRRRQAGLDPQALVEERVDPELFALSYDYVGDLAETVALIWPARAGRQPRPAPRRGGRARCAPLGRAEVPRLLEDWLDALDADGPLGAAETGDRRPARRPLRPPRQAGAGRLRRRRRRRDRGAVARLAPPYDDLFAWLEGRAEKPRGDAAPSSAR